MEHNADPPAPAKASGWHFGLVKHTYADGTVEYGVHELYPDTDGKPTTWTEHPVPAVGDSLQEVLQELQHMLADVTAQVLASMMGGHAIPEARPDAEAPREWQH